MYNNQKVLALITARGGSKGLPGKNVRLLNGVPLIAHTILAARASGCVDRVILSSDDADIMDVACQYGCEVPFVRPASLASDDSTTLSVVLHAVHFLSERYDYVVVLQPTSPLRISADIDGAIATCITQRTRTCATVTDVDKSPYWMVTMDSNGCLHSLLDAPSATRRQDLPRTFIFNGAVYVANIAALLAGGPLTEPGTVGYIMPKERSVDIDTEADFYWAEYLIQKLQQRVDNQK